jgi:hypothetical protein
MNDIDRQKQLESDSLRNGVLRYCQSPEYAHASDSKPVRNLMAEALQPLTQAILQVQLALKAPGSQKLPKYGILCYRSITKPWLIRSCVNGRPSQLRKSLTTSNLKRENATLYKPD